ncbi:hypothetical protein [Anaerofustis sp.]|uniref:hypothetical protein n=1 Tax=Anaerofustis sp. TaxID=1872517 RepID=UPI0025C4F476|nr:hypothetical protein [Anaerofustis sp.]
MLGKLMKYELKATKRIMLPAILVLLLISLFNRLFWGLVAPHFDGSNIIINLFGTIGVSAYVLGIIGIFILSALLCIVRFYKTDLSNEGYLTHTLPINIGKEIISKITIGTFWIVVTGIAVILSLFVTLFMVGSVTSFDFSSFMQDMKVFVTSDYMSSFLVVMFYLFIILVMGCANKILAVYASMAIGFSSNKNKILMSFAAYIGISLLTTFAVTVLGFVFASPISNLLLGLHLSDIVMAHVVFIGIILYLLVLNAVYFFITKYFFENKLNLE